MSTSMAYILEIFYFNADFFSNNPAEEQWGKVLEKGENAGFSIPNFPLTISTYSKERVIHFTHSHTMTPFDAPGKQAF